MGRHMENRSGTDAHGTALTELGDPEFFSSWAELRQRIAFGGKSVPSQLKRNYATLSAEYRRRVNGG
jgi:hypothetical protein